MELYRVLLVDDEEDIRVGISRKMDWASLGFALVGHLNADQQNSLGNFLMLIGQILTTHAGQQQLLSDEGAGQTLASVQQQIACLQARLDALSPQAKTCP